VLIGTKEMGEALGLKARARIKAFAEVGSEPTMMLTGPEFVAAKVLKRAGMAVDDIDIYELNEAFASVVLRFMQAHNIDHDKINVNGGAIAMGHPLGATGAMILGTMVDELERSDKETSLITLCVGDGILVATFDMPGRSMNVLNQGSMADIAELIEMTKSDESIKGVVIASGKKAFCAGADLEEMGGNIGNAKAMMSKDPEGAKKTLYESVIKLNMMFRELETCGKPVAAALNGLALGGGFEFILACPGRFVASDNPGAKVGLPEALIGLLPGGGGTQRLPRLVGLMNASAETIKSG